jgi:hypothetical protein
LLSFLHTAVCTVWYTTVQNTTPKLGNSSSDGCPLCFPPKFTRHTCFTSGFLQLLSDSTSRWTPLPLANGWCSIPPSCLPRSRSQACRAHINKSRVSQRHPALVYVRLTSASHLINFLLDILGIPVMHRLTQCTGQLY